MRYTRHVLPSICLSACPVPTVKSKSENHTTFKLRGYVIDVRRNRRSNYRDRIWCRCAPDCRTCVNGRRTRKTFAETAHTDMSYKTRQNYAARVLCCAFRAFAIMGRSNISSMLHKDTWFLCTSALCAAHWSALACWLP